jgi:hypothetical protein
MASFNQSPLGQTTRLLPSIFTNFGVSATSYNINLSVENFDTVDIVSTTVLSLDPEGYLGSKPGMYPIYRRKKRIISSQQEE